MEKLGNHFPGNDRRLPGFLIQNLGRGRGQQYGPDSGSNFGAGNRSGIRITFSIQNRGHKSGPKSGSNFGTRNGPRIRTRFGPRNMAPIPAPKPSTDSCHGWRARGEIQTSAGNRQAISATGPSFSVFFFGVTVWRLSSETFC